MVRLKRLHYTCANKGSFIKVEYRLFFPLENSYKVSVTVNQNKAQIRFVFSVTKETHHFRLVCPLCSSEKMTFSFWAPWIRSNKGCHGCHLANVPSLWDAERAQFRPPVTSFSALEGRKARHYLWSRGGSFVANIFFKSHHFMFCFLLHVKHKNISISLRMIT